MEAMQDINLSKLPMMTIITLERILYYRHPFKGVTITIDEYNNLDEFMKSYYKPLETFPDGTIVYENYSNRIYTFFNDDYIWMSMPDEDLNDGHIIAIFNCPNCGAPLNLEKIRDNGTCHCKYCDTDPYVWGKGDQI